MNARLHSARSYDARGRSRVHADRRKFPAKGDPTRQSTDLATAHPHFPPTPRSPHRRPKPTGGARKSSAPTSCQRSSFSTKGRSAGQVSQAGRGYRSLGPSPISWRRSRIPADPVGPASMPMWPLPTPASGWHTFQFRARKQPDADPGTSAWGVPGRSGKDRAVPIPSQPERVCELNPTLGD